MSKRYNQMERRGHGDHVIQQPTVTWGRLTSPAMPEASTKPETSHAFVQIDGDQVQIILSSAVVRNHAGASYAQTGDSFVEIDISDAAHFKFKSGTRPAPIVTPSGKLTAYIVTLSATHTDQKYNRTFEVIIFGLPENMAQEDLAQLLLTDLDLRAKLGHVGGRDLSDYTLGVQAFRVETFDNGRGDGDRDGEEALGEGDR